MSRCESTHLVLALDGDIPDHVPPCDDPACISVEGVALCQSCADLLRALVALGARIRHHAGDVDGPS